MKVKERLEQVKCFLFDMDGTIYLEDSILPGTLETLNKLDELGIKYYFLTNNSSRDSLYYKNKVKNMGIDIAEEKILISTHSSIYYLNKKGAKKLFVLGTKELKEDLKKTGFELITEGNKQVDYVVVGFDLQLNYENLCIACQYVDEGVPYMATHPDVRCPMKNGKYIPDCGSFINLINTATGKACQAFTGKPSQYMIDVVLKKTGFVTADLAVVGDRIYTDIALGKNNDILSILLLSGEATLADLKTSSVQPDIIFNGIYELGEML